MTLFIITVAVESVRTHPIQRHYCTDIFASRKRACRSWIINPQCNYSNNNYRKLLDYIQETEYICSADLVVVWDDTRNMTKAFRNKPTHPQQLENQILYQCHAKHGANSVYTVKHKTGGAAADGGKDVEHGTT